MYILRAILPPASGGTKANSPAARFKNQNPKQGRLKMIKRWLNRLAEAWNNFTPSSKADRRHWYLVNKIAVLEEKVRAMENAAYRASRNS